MTELRSSIGGGLRVGVGREEVDIVTEREKRGKVKQKQDRRRCQEKP